jgi:hypothetical protein
VLLFSLTVMFGKFTAILSSNNHCALESRAAHDNATMVSRPAKLPAFSGCHSHFDFFILSSAQS